MKPVLLPPPPPFVHYSIFLFSGAVSVPQYLKIAQAVLVSFVNIVEFPNWHFLTMSFGPSRITAEKKYFAIFFTYLTSIIQSLAV